MGQSCCFHPHSSWLVLMQEFNLRESGFTEADIDEVSKLLVEIEEETLDRHVSTLDLQKTCITLTSR